MRVSHSRVKTWRRCPNQYRYKYVMGLKPRERKTQLERGSWLHELLMVHYDGEDWRLRHRALKKQFMNLFEEEREQLGDLPTECFRIMKSYERTYKFDDEGHHTIDSEMNEVVTLPNGLEVVVVIDLITEDRRGGLWIWDHKTRKSFVDRDILLLDPQLTLYYDALELMGYKNLRGCIANELSTVAPSIPALTYNGTKLSKRKNIATDTYTYMSEIRKHGFNPADYADILHIIGVNQKDRFFRRTAIPKDPPMLKSVRQDVLHAAREIRLAENKNRFPRTVDNSCKWSCDFRDICIAELHGGDIRSMVKMNFKEKEPHD
jgi:RecB family exonuclease